MKRIIKRLFPRNVENSVSKEDLDLIRAVNKETSEKSLDCWTSLWSMDGAINPSIMNISKKILISECGQILKPFEPKMSGKEKQVLSEFVKKIINRDKRLKIRECITIKKQK